MNGTKNINIPWSYQRDFSSIKKGENKVKDNQKQAIC